jgi:rhamnogalacturonyl hydrolase YesR/acetyl esterase/lipase
MKKIPLLCAGLWTFTILAAAAAAELKTDIEYGRAGDIPLLLDASVPDGVGPFPVAILVHGGGWREGDKRGADKPGSGADISPWFDPLTAAHFTWFSINYRLAPGNRWPACFEDVQTAIRWVKAHAAEFKGDPARVALFGHSAGGHLVCFAATQAAPDTRVQAVVGFAPVTDFEYELPTRGGLSTALQGLFGQPKEVNPTSLALLRETAPINHVTSGLPPFLLLHGDADKSVPLQESINFQAKLKASDVLCDLIVIPGAPHRLTEWAKYDSNCFGQMIAWLRRTLVDAAACPAKAPAGGAPTPASSGRYRNRDNPVLDDPGEGTYPVPYQLPKKEEILEVLGRIRAYLEKAAPARVTDSRTGAPITDLSAPVETAVADRGEANAFYNIDYTMGVTHAGMLLCAEVTGDKRYADFTARHMKFIADAFPYFRAQDEKFGNGRRNCFRGILHTESLDDCGAMCAALIKARRAGVGPDLEPVFRHWIDYISHEQFRLPDGTLARRRPQPASLWSDDFYMSIPALAQIGALTGDRAYLDDAARQILQFSARLFDPRTGLYAHGWNANQPNNPEFYWGRANGWAMMATVELLDVLPEDHPARPEILKYLRAHIRAVAKLQSGAGLWHQLLDRNDSYLETSASAMFVYSIAHAINRGWIAPVGYGSVAQAGWNALAKEVTDRGEVANTCVGTTFASDAVYYYNRPVSVYATHGYGPVLLAGAEMIRLLGNDAIEIQYRWRTYHYVPKAK